jgi:hypothetical protein
MHLHALFTQENELQQSAFPAQGTPNPQRSCRHIPELSQERPVQQG